MALEQTFMIHFLPYNVCTRSVILLGGHLQTQVKVQVVYMDLQPLTTSFIYVISTQNYCCTVFELWIEAISMFILQADKCLKCDWPLGQQYLSQI